MSWASRWIETKPPKFRIDEQAHAYVGPEEGTLVIVRESQFPMYLSIKPDIARKLARWIDRTFGYD